MGARGDARAKRFENEAIVHLDNLFGAAIKITKNQTEAEDLTQETFLRAYRFFDRFESGTNCRAWLLRIMTNLYINGYNRKKSEPETIRYEDSSEYYIYRKFTESDYIENPQYGVDWIFDNLLDDDIRRLLGELPREFKISIILCDIQGFSYAEVAEATNVTIGTVKSRLFRARRRIQKGLWEWAAVNGYALKGYVNEQA
ncbi:MAG: sigma-70 family RNA polymerase sigma factor [candidate division Zixibacteria bacterium]